MPPTEPNNPPPTPGPETDDGFEIVSEAETTDARMSRRPLPRAYPVRLPRWVRAWLALLACGFTTILVIALWLTPYTADGSPRTMETHTQMGLPKCNMVVLTGKPCPACGMTTSFSLLAHGDPVASLRANWVGTLLAAYWFALIPWAAISAFRGRLLWVRNGELMISISIGVMCVLMLARWAWVLLV